MRMISPQIEAPRISIAEEQEEYKAVTGALARNSLYGSQLEDAEKLNTPTLFDMIQPDVEVAA